MLLVNPLTGVEVETFTEEATAHLMRQGFWQKVNPKPEDKPKPRRTTTRKKKEQ